MQEWCIDFNDGGRRKKILGHVLHLCENVTIPVIKLEEEMANSESQLVQKT